MLNCLKKNAISGVLDYGQLMSCLQTYKAPHRKITSLLRAGEIVQIKKGLYVLGAEYRQEPICRELLANLIFGPSYISREYALQYYAMIPERVEMLTSITTKRNKLFNTSIGAFQYSYLNPRRFTVGVDWLAIRENIYVLIASPEKAIVDTLVKYKDIHTEKDMRIHLIENLRIEEDSLNQLNLDRLAKITNAYQLPIISLLFATLKRGL